MVSSKVNKIALIGPESTGKTTLCHQLANHFNTLWVPEYSREFVANLKRKYTLADIEFCTIKQLEQEDASYHTANRFLFIDTELIVAKVWCEDVFKSCPAWLTEETLKRKYDLYLLTCPDLPFEVDPVRENPNRRDYFFNLYKSELDKINADVILIEGIGNIRFENALKGILGKFPDYR